jgi:predicted O-methyltransferase YrrM
MTLVTSFPQRALRPIRRRLGRGVDQLRAARAATRLLHPPGHYYSPLPSLEEISARRAILWPEPPPSRLGGIDTRDADQLLLVSELARFHDDQPFGDEPGANRYGFRNDFYGPAEGIVLYCMLRHLRPSRVVEVGSGFSSALMLDTRDRHLPDIDFTFIEPNPAPLQRLLTEQDRVQVQLLVQQVQDVPLDVFSQLGAGDILFIDSSHQMKLGSDVNDLLFRVLPALERGVYVHFHDIAWPFEYPQQYAMRGGAWNEAYALHAFLQYNNRFEIALWPGYLEHFHRAELGAALPLALTPPPHDPTLGSGAIWLRTG